MRRYRIEAGTPRSPAWSSIPGLLINESAHTLTDNLAAVEAVEALGPALQGFLEGNAQ